MAEKNSYECSHLRRREWLNFIWNIIYICNQMRINWIKSTASFSMYVILCTLSAKYLCDILNNFSLRRSIYTVSCHILLNNEIWGHFTQKWEYEFIKFALTSYKWMKYSNNCFNGDWVLLGNMSQQKLPMRYNLYSIQIQYIWINYI